MVSDLLTVAEAGLEEAGVLLTSANAGSGGAVADSELPLLLLDIFVTFDSVTNTPRLSAAAK